MELRRCVRFQALETAIILADWEPLSKERYLRATKTPPEGGVFVDSQRG
jgi:hypothetical protein